MCEGLVGARARVYDVSPPCSPADNSTLAADVWHTKYPPKNQNQYMSRFVDDESKTKRGGKEMDISEWPRFNYDNVPHQRNLIDCGELSFLLSLLGEAGCLEKERGIRFIRATGCTILGGGGLIV